MINLLVSLLFIVIFYQLYVYLRKINGYFKDLGIPYIPSVPFLGNMKAVFFFRKHFNEALKDLYNYHPNAKYVGIYNTVQPVIMIRDLEIIKNITIKHFNHFMDHQKLVGKDADPLFNKNILSLNGEAWREARNILSPAFTCSKMKILFDYMIPCVENLFDYIEESIKNSSNFLDVKDLFTKLTSDVIATCAFGIETNTFKDPENQFYVYSRHATKFDGVMSLKLLAARAIPKLTRLLRVSIVSDKMRRFLTKIVSSIVATRDEKGIVKPDVIQLMMNARGKDNKYSTFDTNEMAGHLFAFLFAGLDSTSTQMCILAYELAINEDIQSKLRDEIDTVLRRTDGDPKYEDVQDLAYLEAVFQESMRKHSQFNILERICTKPYELPPALPNAKPFVVPVRMSIWIPMSGIHNDEKYYENPRKFDPERYLDKKVTTNQPENLGFGIGPRSCIGNRFAILETKTLFFYLLSKFALKLKNNSNVNFEYSKKNITIVPIGGYKLIIEPRK